LQVPDEFEGGFLHLLLVDQRVHLRCSESLYLYSSFPPLGENNFLIVINHLLVFFAGRMLSNISKAELVEMAKKMRVVEPSGVQALKNPNPLKDVEAFVVLGVVVLV